MEWNAGPKLQPVLKNYQVLISSRLHLIITLLGHEENLVGFYFNDMHFLRKIQISFAFQIRNIRVFLNLTKSDWQIRLFKFLKKHQFNIKYRHFLHVHQ